MLSRHRALALSFGILTSVGMSLVARAETIELRNDELDQQGNAAFQSGFVSGEMGAVTLGPVADAFEVRKVRFLYGPDQGVGGGGGSGGGPGDYEVTLRIYQDDGNTDPGSLLHENTYVVVPASDSIQEIDLTASAIGLPSGSSFRVAIEMDHDGPPSIARDDDGCDGARNWIYGAISPDPAAWHDYCALGGLGDFVIRAEVETGASSSGTGGGGTGGGGVGGGGVGGAASCAPGESLSCVGSDGCSGTQVCADDGSGFGDCSCGSAPAAGASDDGCGCALPGGGGSGKVALLVGSLILLLAASRRRR